jgi:hypothetical protein
MPELATVMRRGVHARMVAGWLALYLAKKEDDDRDG